MLIGDIIDFAALNGPDRPALSVPGGVRETYGELRDNVARLAAVIAERTVPGERVAILSTNAPEYVHALYGVPAAAATLVLLNYRLHANEWAAIVQASGAVLLLVNEDLAEAACTAMKDAPALREILTFGPGGEQALDNSLRRADLSVLEEVPRPSDADPAWIIYTSGTTGFPKGAQVSHRGIVRALTGHLVELRLGPGERFLMTFPLCHAAAYQVPMLHFRGAEVILPKSFEAGGWLETVESRRVTATALAPTMFSFVLGHPAAATTDVSSIRSIGYGGMPMARATAVAAMKRFGPVLAMAFGATETTGLCTCLSSSDHARALAGDEHLLQSCGRPMAQVGVGVFDESMKRCPPGEVGELMACGDQMMIGYLDDSDATAAATTDGWLHTGDLAQTDSGGYIYLVDRRNDTIISGGQNVYPTQVERILYEHPAVREVAVVGLYDEVWGQVVAAAISLMPGSEVAEEELAALCRDNLAGYKTPRRISFLPELPKNASGKIVRRLVRAQLSKGDG